MAGDGEWLEWRGLRYRVKSERAGLYSVEVDRGEDAPVCCSFLTRLEARHWLCQTSGAFAPGEIVHGLPPLI